ncbi:hypothetical protein [Nesterenkonia lutea]|uniref:Uncharacterized protein n=1 Tax=Nesterenkonia lutea TaxID=272919 RepID=A0ABR9JBZ2_9MICC|nr:hypothetical protein [Nesterenkonia lutea]MBE1523002.1 hypothetical protein [Nesterenkonia lutea]
MCRSGSVLSGSMFPGAALERTAASGRAFSFALKRLVLGPRGADIARPLA